MRVNNNYIRVVATFIGEDGSREFKKRNCIYFENEN